MRKDSAKNNENVILIPYEIINNDNISDYGLSVYCILHALCIQIQLPIQCVTYKQIVFYLTGEYQKRRLINEHIRDGINELIKQNVIKKENEIEKHLILDCSNLWIDIKKGNFVKVTFDEVCKIFKIKDVNNFSLLRYFIVLIGTINSKTTVYLDNGNYKNNIVGNFTIDYLAELTGLSQKTIIEYNKKLENEELLYIFRQNDFIIDKEGNIKRFANVYGRYCDKEYIDKFANNQLKHKEGFFYKKNSVESSNNKRKLAQMYQQLLKDETKTYSKEEVIDIYNYVLSENKKYQNMYKKDGDEKFLDKIRDMEVFNRFDYLDK